MEENKNLEVSNQVKFSMHPRVFAALGADLVTNDVVAAIEVVKNSYDAFAKNVWVTFGTDETMGDYLEIKDDGYGMSKATIENVWFVVATPFKKENPIVVDGKKTRRVSGEKGLGRLSVARLGHKLQILTQELNGPCWEISVNWSALENNLESDGDTASYYRYREDSPFKVSGTIVRVYELNNRWNKERVAELEDNLARMISPFAEVGDFNIFLSNPWNRNAGEVRVESPEFLSSPKYKLSGKADESGSVTASYRYAPLNNRKKRSAELRLSWEQIYDSMQDAEKHKYESSAAHCGGFDFEIRAWDVGAEDTAAIATRFDFRKSQVRKAIKAHKGISVYRDGILVLPKSDNARDWLGLDLRRVSRVGTRLSTSQIVGYVSISAEDNPEVNDTSDRERLVSGRAVGEFEEILKAAIGLLENERANDKETMNPSEPMTDLFGGLSAEEVLAEAIALVNEGAEAADVIPLLQSFNSNLTATQQTIRERFVFYSRLATVGTIAHMLVHEIRNRTTALGVFLSSVRDRFGPFHDEEVLEEYRMAVASINSLERLADTFSPLANRGFRRGKRTCIVEDQIRDSLTLQQTEIEAKRVECQVPATDTKVTIDPGELDSVLLNLVSNALYWLSTDKSKGRQLKFSLTDIDDGKRVRVWVHDNGPGIERDDVEKVFWPGITRKPGGIGMGLTVASEVVAAHGGHMTIKTPGTLGGASFAFDLPLAKD